MVFALYSFLHVSIHCVGVCHLLYMSIIFRSLLFGRKGVNFDRCKRVCGWCEMYYYTSLVNRKFHKWIFISNIVVRSLSFMSYLSWTMLRIIPTQNWFEAYKIILQINITFFDIPDEYGNNFNTRHFSGCDWYILYFCTYIWYTCCASFYMFVGMIIR